MSASVVWCQRQHAGDIRPRSTTPSPTLYWWFGGFCAFSIVFGAVGAGAGVRRAFGRFRPVGDPADRRGWTGAVITLGATVASSVLAGVAGVLDGLVDGRRRRRRGSC